MGRPTLVYPLEVMGVEKPAREIGKDGLTVKKLIGLLLVVAFVCASTVGCGDTGKSTNTGGAKQSGGGGAAPGGAKPPEGK